MESPDDKNNMTMGKAFIYYLGSLAALVGFWWVMYGLVSIGLFDEKAKWPFIPMLLLYFGIGIFLGRVVLRNLIEWHPMHNTVSNVASAKVKQMLFWPISYPILLINLFASEKL